MTAFASVADWLSIPTGPSAAALQVPLGGYMHFPLMESSHPTMHLHSYRTNVFAPPKLGMLSRRTWQEDLAMWAITLRDLYQTATSTRSRAGREPPSERKRCFEGDRSALRPW